MRVLIKFFFIFAAIALILGLAGCGAFHQVSQGISAIGHAVSWLAHNLVTLLVIAGVILIAIFAGPAIIRHLPWWLSLIFGGGALLWLAGRSGSIGKIFSGIVSAVGGIFHNILSMAGGLAILAIVLFGLWVMVGRPRRH